MQPEDKAADAASSAESYGSPTRDRSERVSMEPRPDNADAASSAESYGSPAREAAERVALVPLPDIAGMASVLDAYGAPASEASERVGLWPMALQAAAGSAVEGYGSPSRDRDERVDIHPKPDLDKGGNVLESYGTPSEDAAERVGLEPVSPAAGGASVMEAYGAPSAAAEERVDVQQKPDFSDVASVVESYGQPSRKWEDRVSLVPEPDLDKGGNVLESYGAPSRDPDERVDVHPKPDLDKGGNVLESYGAPSREGDDRVSLAPEPDLAGGGNVLESYGTPTPDPGDRVDLHPKPDLSSGNSVEAYGHPSRLWEERTPVIPGPSEAQLETGNVLESYGAPSREGSDRVDVVEKPDLEAGRSVEVYGHPSRFYEDRAPVQPEATSERLEQGRVLETYGQPVADREERVDVHPKPDLQAGATLEAYGQPSKVREQRVDLDPEPEIDADSSTMTSVGSPSRSRSERIDVDPEPDVDPDSSTMTSVGSPSQAAGDRIDLEQKPDIDVESSSLAGAARTSRDRTDRMGRIDPDAEPDEEALAASALQLSRDRSDRVGYVDPTAETASSLGGVGSRSVLEAGRLALTEDPDKAFRGEVPTGLESLMPDRRLRGHDRMRLTEEEDYEIPPELVGKIPIPPRVVQVVGTLSESERVGACGDNRVLKREHVHRRMDFLYQRYEELHVRRGYYHCPVHPEEPVHKCRQPMFVAGGVPIGNGLLAQILASVYDDHSSVFDQAGLLDRIGFSLEEEQIEKALDRATVAMQPVLDALRAELTAGSGKPTVDKSGVDTARPGRRRTVDGHLLVVSRPDATLLVHLDKGETDELVKSVPPSRRKGERVRDLFRERVGFNRSGIWAGVRRRFTTALATSPQEAAYALFLIHAIATAASPARGQHDELVRRSRALRAWLDDQRDQFDDPDNALQRAVVYALSCWDRMRLVDDAGDGKPIDEPPARRFPKTYTPLWDFKSEEEVRRAVTWYSLVHTCRMLGVRPWEYFFAAFSAMARGTLEEPTQWTPRAWAAATGI